MSNPLAAMYRLYDADRDLLSGLGIPNPPTEFPHGQGVAVGSVSDAECETFQPNTVVLIEVTMMPAAFWCFTITSDTEDVQPGTLVTGSGSLAHYWPTVVEWAGGGLGFTADQEPDDR